MVGLVERVDTVDGLYHIRTRSPSSFSSRLLALLGLDRAPRCQARAGYLDLSLLASRGRALALVVAVQDEDLAITVRVAEHTQDELLRDLVVRLDGSIDAELK